MSTFAFMHISFINIHTHKRGGCGIEVVSVMAGQRGGFPSQPFSVGIHPWQIADFNEAGLAKALRKIKKAPAWAIGEIGLDYATEADHDRQAVVFSAQLRIAQERRMPVVLHCVKAFETTMELLAGYDLPAVIFHGFVGSPEQAIRAVEAGYYISFGERSFGSPKTVEAMHAIPLERIFFETDDAPTTIAHVYFHACEILGVTLKTLVEAIYGNYEQLVGTH